MKRLKQFSFLGIALIVSVFLVVGCASIMKGTKQKVTVSSSPPQAKVVIETTPGGVTVYEGTTPVKVKLRKKKEYIVTVSLEGYKDETVNIMEGDIEGWFWGNLLCGGLIGIVVDLSNNAMHKLEPEEIHVELIVAQLPGQEDALYLVYYALDSNGQLRNLTVPLLKDVRVDFSVTD